MSVRFLKKNWKPSKKRGLAVRRLLSVLSSVLMIWKTRNRIITKDGKPGPVCTKLYNKLRAIQYGDEPDTHNWVTILD